MIEEKVTSTEIVRRYRAGPRVFRWLDPFDDGGCACRGAVLDGACWHDCEFGPGEKST